MCPARTPFDPPISVLLPLEPETHKRVRVMADIENQTLTHFLINIIESIVYKEGAFDPRELEEEDRLAIKGQRTPGAIPWARGYSRAYRKGR